MKAFSTYHPAVLFFYYIGALLFAMITMHPALLAASAVGAILFFCCMYAGRPGVIARNLIYYLLLFFLLSVVNPLFSHNGEKILFFMNGNPVTLEAVVYGTAIALLMIAVMFWCKCYNEVMTTDKFLYLFGKAIPRLSLILSMALRFLPLFKRQIGKISQAQKTMGLYTSDSFVDKIRSSFRIFGAILTWSLENAVDTADSMKARGYGMKGRTNFSIFRFQLRDGALLAVVALLGGILVAGIGSGAFAFQYYPYIAWEEAGAFQVLSYLAAFLFMLLPVIIEVKEKIQWKLLKSKI